MGDKVTNPMPGNPYAQQFNKIEASDEAEATLALAHEQRTATLVNVVRMYADLGMGDQAAGIIVAITNRLGGYDHE
ncbi:hypothetical protein [Brevibacterium pigmentatum]|uniref:hypothetical protein n=1 Tax=Brevibacterium pigmentatum TaxID=1496080 RepID=UPI00141EC59A|nr:hypothetical protein [Brevibacterium pigmentatum]